jgi:hypothetical protein
MMNAMIAVAAIGGIDFSTLKDKFPEMETFTNEDDYNKTAEFGDIVRESAVMNAAILHGKLKVHFNEEDSIKVLCAILATMKTSA